MQGQNKPKDARKQGLGRENRGRRQETGTGGKETGTGGKETEDGGKETTRSIKFAAQQSKSVFA